MAGDKKLWFLTTSKYCLVMLYLSFLVLVKKIEASKDPSFLSVNWSSNKATIVYYRKVIMVFDLIASTELNAF